MSYNTVWRINYLHRCSGVFIGVCFFAVLCKICSTDFHRNRWKAVHGPWKKWLDFGC